MFDVWCSMYDVRCSMYDVRCMMYDVRCMMFDVWCMMFDVLCSMYDVWCLMYDVRSLMFDVWCSMYHVWCSTYDVWCLMYDVRCMMFDVWCLMYDVWCMMFGVWCLMFDVWCMMYDEDKSILHTSQAYIVLMCVRAELQLNLANWLYLGNSPLSPSDEHAYAWASASLPRSRLPDQQELTNRHNYQAGNPPTAKITANLSPKTNSRLITACNRDHGYMSFSQQLACVSRYSAYWAHSAYRPSPFIGGGERRSLIKLKLEIKRYTIRFGFTNSS